jgi:hypothetical protein
MNDIPAQWTCLDGCHTWGLDGKEICRCGGHHLSGFLTYPAPVTVTSGASTVKWSGPYEVPA